MDKIKDLFLLVVYSVVFFFYAILSGTYDWIKGLFVSDKD